ncbi:MAG: hypothetical protein WCB15_34600 [Desulfobacterales bacterium]
MAKQLLAQLGAAAETESAHTADHVPGVIVFHPAAGHGRMPTVVTVEIAQHGPDPIDWGVNDGRLNDGDLHNCP